MRIQVIGASCAGKTTLGAELAEVLDVPFIEMDELNWLPGWVGLNNTDPEEFENRLRRASAGPGWVAAGFYTKFSLKVLWPRVQTVIWLDLPLPLLLRRVVARSWRRWRTKELLWGTNYENFWTNLKIWRKQESLLWWTATTFARRRKNMIRFMADPQWSHINFLRLTTPAEVEMWKEAAFPSLAIKSAAAGHVSRPT